MKASVASHQGHVKLYQAVLTLTSWMQQISEVADELNEFYNRFYNPELAAVLPDPKPLDKALMAMR